ncbi:MAG: aquaporin [Acholeplasmatales bacterium]|nr:aquaporin [Acholeplasmatales bacterium]
MNSLLKKMIAECIGTFVLVFVACGVAMATGGTLVGTALAFGLVIVAMAYSIGRISGCHINPAVSIALFIRKKISFEEFCGYVIAQVVGGFLGALAIFGIFKMSGVALPGDACNYIVGWNGTDITVGGVFGALIAEVVLTFIFVYVILNATDEEAGNSKIAGLIIGLTLTLVHLVGICLTGTSVNPARSIATAFGTLIYNGDASALAQVWIFIVAPIAGGALAAVVFGLLHKNKPNNEAKNEDLVQ